MEKVIISKNKIYFATYTEESKKWKKSDIDKLGRPISYYLPYKVELSDGVTVEDLLRNLARYDEHIDLVFAGYLQDAEITDFIKELEKPADEDISKKISFIEFFWNIELVAASETDIAEYKINQYPSFRGVYPDEGDLEDILITFEEYFDLSLISIKNFKKVKLAINNFVEYSNYDVSDNPLQTSLLDGELDWTFFDLISSFLTEISLYGKPDEQMKVREEILKDINELENTQSIIGSSELFEYLDSLDPAPLS